MNEDTPEVKIRLLKIWEVPGLLSFRAVNDYKAKPEKGRPESAFYALLKIIWHRKRMTTFVAELNGSIVGYITMVFGRHNKFHGNTYLVSASISADQRGKGIGTRLFRTAEENARRRGARRIEFDVFSKNTRALALYKRLGYEIEGVKRQAVENNGVYDDLIFMAKLLN